MTDKYYYFDTQGNDDAAYDRALNFAANLVKESKELNKIIFLVASRDATGWLERLFDSQTVKKMFTGATFSGINVKIETIRTYKNTYSNPSDIIICCGLNSEEIFKIQDYRQVDVIIAIPWLKENTESWINTANAKKINEDLSVDEGENAAAYPKPSAIVKKAFKELTSVINTSTGINHPSDNSRAKTYVKALYKYEPELNSDIVCSYIINELGWQVRHADDIRKLIDTMNSGKFFKGGEKTGLQLHYKRWKNN